MEETILSENPHLKTLLLNVRKINKEPVSIAQISFLKKTQVEDHVVMLGDAAGMITPLCGNGMSMAMHSSLLAAVEIGAFLEGIISRQIMEDNYTRNWQQHFAKRLATGRMIQYFFGKKWLTNVFITTMKHIPALTRRIIKMTHGNPF
jgi:flavin-dependent dehydrogenase